MTIARMIRGFFAASMSCGALAACTVVTEPAAPREECRTVEVRRPADVEVCHKRCNENGCHEHCKERERWSREHRCWVD